MKKTLPAEYEVTIIPEEDGYFAARLPDFPGIITGGRTPEEALSNAREALAATLETMRARKIPLPTPKRTGARRRRGFRPGISCGWTI